MTISHKCGPNNGTCTFLFLNPSIHLSNDVSCMTNCCPCHSVPPLPPPPLPRYMAPEVLSSQVTPASDLWSAGVMAHQLLTGRLPFDDHRNPMAPSISAVWKSVLTEKVDYNMPWWKGVSDDAKDFVYTMLNR